MLKRIKLPGWITVIFLLAVIITGMGQLTQAGINKSKNQTTDKKTEKQQDEKYISTKYPGLTITTETTNKDTYTSAISTLLTEDKQINKTIQLWINEQKKNFMTDIKEPKNIPTDGHKAHLNIQVDTNKVTEDIYSLVFSSKTYTGEANGINIVKVFNIDLKNNTFLHIEDVLNINNDTLSMMRELVDEELQKNEDIYFYVIDDALEEVINDPNNWKWSVNKKEFTFYFDKYEIATREAGPIKLKIPLQKVSLYLNKDIESLLQMPEEQQKEKENIIQEGAKLDSNGKYVALTFDNGPNPKVTPRVLETLKEHGATATFFMLGSQVDYYPEIVEQVAIEGHEIGNHSTNHPDFTNLSTEEIHQEIDKTNHLIEDAIGTKPTVTRPPYGAYNDDLIKIAKNNESPIVLWSVNSLDEKTLNADAVQKEITPGSIVLMHDTLSTTADALPELLDRLEREGYQFITVSQMLNLQDQNGIGPYDGKVK